MRRFFVGTSAVALLLSALVAVTTPTPASAGIGPNPKLVGTYDVKVKVNPAFGGTKLSGQITLTGDGEWTGNVLNGLGCTERGSWLATGTVLALSDLDPGNVCDPNKTGLTWMVTVGTNRTLGSAASPGYLNAPYKFNATWDAVPAPEVAPAPHTSSAISPNPNLLGTFNAKLTFSGLQVSSSISLNSDGTWTSSWNSFTCGSTGTWLSSEKTIALSANALLRAVYSSKQERGDVDGLGEERPKSGHGRQAWLRQLPLLCVRILVRNVLLDHRAG